MSTPYTRIESAPPLPEAPPAAPATIATPLPPPVNTAEHFASLLIIVNPDSSLGVATTPDNEYLVLGKGTDALPVGDDGMIERPYTVENESSPRVYVRLARDYYSNPMRTRRRKFLISLLLSDILYCLLLLSATREFTLFTVLLICIVLIDLLGIVGASRDHLAILTTFIIFSSASVIAQSIMAFSPLFILRILVVLMAFRVRGELMLQSQLFPS